MRRASSLGWRTRMRMRSLDRNCSSWTTRSAIPRRRRRRGRRRGGNTRIPLRWMMAMTIARRRQRGHRGITFARDQWRRSTIRSFTRPLRWWLSSWTIRMSRTVERIVSRLSRRISRMCSPLWFGFMMENFGLQREITRIDKTIDGIKICCWTRWLSTHRIFRISISRRNRSLHLTNERFTYRRSIEELSLRRIQYRRTTNFQSGKKEGDEKMCHKVKVSSPVDRSPVPKELFYVLLLLPIWKREKTHAVGWHAHRSIYFDARLILAEKVCTHVCCCITFEIMIGEPGIETRVVLILQSLARRTDATHLNRTGSHERSIASWIILSMTSGELKSNAQHSTPLKYY